MNNNTASLSSLLNLASNENIGLELANRQTECIVKAYQYLQEEGNNIIYLADEVGMGKTYIAAGVLMLQRHFSINPQNHKDVIIVPKKNLQEKWQNDLNNFVENNYIGTNDFIKRGLHLEGCKKDRIKPIRVEDPISIFRMTSFSSVAIPRKSEFKRFLIEEIFNNDPLAVQIINKAWEMGYSLDKRQRDLRKIVAYLLNALSPKIDCLVVDEAHNYKHGLKDDNEDVSNRNETTSRFLGTVCDIELLKAFPELLVKIKFPLADKIICLSATPKDKQLLEIKNQFNCFTNNHILSTTKTTPEVKNKLKQFLIRGNLEYSIEGEKVSRNQCRFEHRLGNVNKSETAELLLLKDNFQTMFWQLLQYKSIKMLDAKANASFEIGMLAGFESYDLDIAKTKEKFNEAQVYDENEDPGMLDKSYDLTQNRKITESRDYDLVKDLVHSYQEEFADSPPHPKQAELVKEITKQLHTGEKSLIFVRRVASAAELKKRISTLYEKEIICDKQLNFKNKYVYFNTEPVLKLLKEYTNRNTREKRDELFMNLLEKNEIKNFIISKNQNYDRDVLKKWLENIFLNNEKFAEVISKHIKEKRQIITAQLKEATIKAMDATSYAAVTDEDDETEDEVEDDDGYFFHNYFKKDNNGFGYRNKMYRESWFELDILQLNSSFSFLNYNASILEKEIQKENFNTSKRKQKQYENRQNFIYSFLEKNASKKSESSTDNSTPIKSSEEINFLTGLLCNLCVIEFEEWVKKRLYNPKADQHSLIKDIRTLNAILKGIFRNGSGLLAGFVANASNKNFSVSLLDLISDEESPFHIILREVKTIISDFDLIVSNNFHKNTLEKVSLTMKSLSPIVSCTGKDKKNRGILAAQFRMPGYPYVLITTDIFREGEDLHSYCQNVYHYGIAWNPSDMEQRTGRIDRINSLSYRKLNNTNRLLFDNKVQVFYPYLPQSIEINQVVALLKSMNTFVTTFNDIEKDLAYDKTALINQDISKDEIPKQIEDKLKSLYDIDEFVISSENY